MGPRKRAKPNPADEDNTASPSSLPNFPQTNMPSPSQSSSQVSPVRPNAPNLVASKSTSTTASSTASMRAPSVSRGTTKSTTLLPIGAGDGTNESKSTGTGRRSPKQAHKTRSWYGSWPRVPKSTALTQVARETIQGGTLKPRTAADFSRFETTKSADSMSVNSTPDSPSTLSVPKDPENDEFASDQPVNPADSKSINGREPEDPKKPGESDEAHDQNMSTDPVDGAPKEEEETKAAQSAGWFGWLSRPVYQPVETKPAEDPEEVQHQSTAQPSEVQEQPQPPEQLQEPSVSEPLVQEPVSETTAQAVPAAATGSSWFGFWYGSSTAPTTAVPSQETAPPPTEPEAAPEAPQETTKAPANVDMQDAPPIAAVTTPPPKQGSTWAFWSRDTGSSSSKKPIQQRNAEQGELAVMGEGSESRPENTALDINETSTPPKEPSIKSVNKDDQGKGAVPTLRETSSKKSKRGRPLSMDVDDASSPSRPSTPKADAPSKAVAEPTPKPASSKASSTTKALPPNLLLPSFKSTYRMKEDPSILRQITQLLLRTQQPTPKHVFICKEQPKFKRVLAIGVHGLLPANYLRPIIGQPTGTSIKFADHCVEAIRRWADAHGCEDYEIEKIALEGEGKINERVENLWKLLLNWVDHIRHADLIIVGCHSQGVPVSIMLLAKLIDVGIITNAKIGVCAMAGVSLGPFPEYRSNLGRFMGTANELWEFADPNSEVSKKLEVSVKAVLNYGARITYIGSIDDQVVPLESAIYAPAHHPYIYRAVFIDGRIHAPDFIAHLVGFALKLRNLGVTDHGLIRELSVPLAGSLYSGEGHSRLYDDEQVYDLAVSHALETTNIAVNGNNVPCEIHQRQPGSLANPNPYHLPWIMRGLLEEEFVKSELDAETEELLRQFDDWKPVTKALKDVKYRLEAVRSKL